MNMKLLGVGIKFTYNILVYFFINNSLRYFAV